MAVDIKKNWALSQLGITMEITTLRGAILHVQKSFF
jgi:hypothetical protein